MEPVPIDGIYLPQILHGLGSGMVDIPLLVAAHASCRKRADVATATGFVASVKDISLLLARAACEAVLEHFGPVTALDALRPTEYYSGETGGYSVRAVWGFLAVANVVIMAVNFSATVVGMRDVNTPGPQAVLPHITDCQSAKRSTSPQHSSTQRGWCLGGRGGGGLPPRRHRGVHRALEALGYHSPN